MGAKLTPMMERYQEVKAQNPEAILLFRMGDFYELFHEDAVVAARVLGISLTSRDKNSENPVPMAGFPYHSLDGYLQKLIRAGHRAAICDQVEDPKQAKGMVRREVTRIVTPGTLTDDSLLDPRENNFLAAVFPGKENVGVAWVELSTGYFRVAELEPSAIQDELARIAPTEILLPDDVDNMPTFADMDQTTGTMVTRRPTWEFGRDVCEQNLKKHFAVRTLEGFGLEDDADYIPAAGSLIAYLQETQKTSLEHIGRIELHQYGSTLLIDEATRRSLELSQTIRGGKREGSLVSVLDETVSPMGARRLADWLASPSTDLEEINQRLDAVDELYRQPVLTGDLREQIGKTYDMQRLTARVATGRCSPRDLSCLTRTLALLPKIKALLTERHANRLNDLQERLLLCVEIRSAIDAALVEEPPLLVSEGGMIREGFHAELDEYRTLSRGGKEWIAKYQAQEAERTGIPNLKVGYNKVFGYYLEVTAVHQDKVPEDYIRKQTLKNQERYITPELKEYEEKVLSADEKAVALEQQLFNELREQVAGEIQQLQQTSNVIAEVDVLANLAFIAAQRGYCRPEMTDEPNIDVREARHPVLDVKLPGGEFVPNDLRLGTEQGRVQIITGPNMAGKSTYIRQGALLNVMAQLGSFVPASEARIGIADRIFARVGASDELGKGQSTFMVEMTETARILNTATERSLVILDEIGRGTSTYDGISLAWAVTEFLHDVVACRTLFATHYHELTELTTTLTSARNWNVAVKERDEDIIFLHKIVEGSADKSYGIHVARLAGVPGDVIQRAAQILTTLEENHLNDAGLPAVPQRTSTKQKQLQLFEVAEHPVLDHIRELDVNQMTPMDALQKLADLQGKVKK